MGMNLFFKEQIMAKGK